MAAEARSTTRSGTLFHVKHFSHLAGAGEAVRAGRQVVSVAQGGCWRAGPRRNRFRGGSTSFGSRAVHELKRPESRVTKLGKLDYP
jgi:hypothetical protein